MCSDASLNISDTERCPGRINVDVATGQVIVPSWGTTRNEEDALAPLQRLIASDPFAKKWHIILDNLNIHQSAALVRWVAEQEGIAAETLGVKGKSGILRSRKAVLRSCTTTPITWFFTTHRNMLPG